MRKVIIALLSIVLAVSAQTFNVTMDEAQATVTQYLYSGEMIDIQPPALTYLDTKAYWVFEAKSMSQIQIMFPVDAELNVIDTAVTVKPALKTHYLSNYLTTDSSLTDYLNSQLSFAQSKKDSCSRAYDDFVFYEAQFDENVVLPSLDPLKAALKEEESKADEVRTKVNALKTKMTKVDRPSVVSEIRTDFTSFFSSQSTLLTNAEDVARKATELSTELASNDYLKTNRTDLLQALQGTIVTYKLRDSVTKQTDDLKETQNNIDVFFSGIEQKTDEYYLKLQKRTSSLGQGDAIKNITSKIAAYYENYTELGEKASALPSDYVTSSKIEDDLDSLFDLINQSNEKCAASDLTECQDAVAFFGAIEDKIRGINTKINNYKQTCASGETQQCTTADGKTGAQRCINSAWGACKADEQPAGGINWLLIIGLVIIITGLLAFKFKDKIIPQRETSQGEGKYESNWGNKF